MGRWDVGTLKNNSISKINMESFFPKSHVKLSQQQQLTKKERKEISKDVTTTTADEKGRMESHVKLSQQQQPTKKGGELNKKEEHQTLVGNRLSRDDDWRGISQ